MQYPQSLNQKLEEIKYIVEKWTIPIPFEEVVKWMMQFDNNDFELAFRIIKNLNVIGYEQLKDALNIAYSKLERKSIDKNTKINSKNTLFAGIGEGGKSGAMISYNFRMINELSEENFLDEGSLIHIEQGRIENIVLVDDIISTGNQAIKEIQKLTDSLIPLGVKNIFLLTAVGMKNGIKKVEEETGAYVFSAFEYDVNDTVQSYDSNFYDGLEFTNRILLKEKLQYYGSISSPKNPLGYGAIGGLIVFYYNTPNSTIPHIWSSLNSWIPLFKRSIRINGIDSYYKQFDNLKSQKPKPKTGKGEFTIFVEGKNDEIFIELLNERLKEITNSDKVNVIALGGMFSEKLIENLNKTQTRYLFIIEDDQYAPPSYKKRIDSLFKGKPHVKMQPLIEYFDIENVLKDEFFNRIVLRNIKSLENLDLKNNDIIREIEMVLFRRPFNNREVILRKLFEQYLNQSAIDKLLSNIVENVK